MIKMSEKHDFNTFRIPLTSEMIQYHERKTGPRSKSPRNYSQRRSYVSQFISTFEDKIEPIVLDNQLINPELIFRLTCSEGDSIDLHDLEGSCRFNILSTDKDGSVVLFTKREDIGIFKARLRTYCSESGSKLDLYDKIDLPKVIQDKERIGISILKNPLADDFEETDIFLRYFGPSNHPQIYNFMEKICKKIELLSGTILNRELFPEFPLIQAKINKNIFDILVKEPTIRIIERKIKLSPDHHNYNLQLNPKFKTATPQSNMGILVLDGSLATGHLLISPAIREYDIDETSHPVDLEHGTAVSILALYGDIAEIISRKKPIFKPVGTLYFSSIYDEEGVDSPEKLEKTIEYFLNHHQNIKIINISVASEMILDSLKLKQLPLGAVIDKIIYKYSKFNREIIFVISTGNFFDYSDPTLYGAQEEYAYIRNFRNILLSFADNKIKDPASSSLALTIGSINLGINISGSNVIESYLSKRYFPSIFARVGPGVNGSIKPDFVDFGSDVIQLNKPTIDEQRSGVLVPIIDQYGLFGYDNGSSFSTPIFSNKILQFWLNYPELTANSVKCLMVLGAEIKEEMKEFLSFPGLLKNLKKNQFSDILNIFGNGYVNLNNSLYSTNNFVVLLRERELGIKKFDLFDIPIPNEFFTSRGKSRIQIAISYTPPTRARRQDYLGIELDFHIFSNLSKDEIHKYYDLLQKNDFNEEGEFELNSHPVLQESEFDIDHFDQENEDQRKKFAQIISKNKELVMKVLNGTYSEKVKNKVLSNYIGAKKWTGKLYPPKELSKHSTLKNHCMEWTRSTPTAVPREHGLKILVYSKFSSTRWLEKELRQNSNLDNFKFKYSIAVSVKTKTDINLRNRIRQIIRDRIKIRR